MLAEILNPKILVVLGPTAVGKSALAVELAQKYNGEIISADSRQVYRGVDLMTGIISDEEMCGIPHHLLRIRNISDPYSVSDFVKNAGECIQDIVERGKLPIVCGGTAMYIDALVYNQIFPKVGANEELRLELKDKSISDLNEILKSLDPVRASTIDTRNPRRLVRAIEIATTLGAVPEITHDEPRYNSLLSGLTRSKEELDLRIKERIADRMSLGMLSEVLDLHTAGNQYDYIRTFGLEFSHLSDIAELKKTEKEALEKLYFDTVHYAKRQVTWWKRNKDIKWFAPSDIEKIEETVNDFLAK